MEFNITELNKDNFYLINLQINEEVKLDKFEEFVKNIFDCLTNREIKTLVVPTGVNLSFKK